MLKILFFQFLLILTFNLSHADDYLEIDIDKSSITFSVGPKYPNQYSWNVSVSSVLKTENDTYFLLKETMAENMSITPFANTNAIFIFVIRV